MRLPRRWLWCALAAIPACGGSQAASEPPETDPVEVSTVTQSPEQSKESTDAEIARSAGIISLMGDACAPQSIFGVGTAFDSRIDNALDGLAGSTVGDAHGAGTLVAVGKGAGGGGSALGAGFGRLGSARSQSPRVVQRDPTVVGALDKDSIRSVVRRHIYQFRYCYERWLGPNPTLEGEVITRFVIAPRGHVVSVQDAGSSMPNDGVKSCVQSVFRRMTFPEPKDGGRVIVTCPVTFVSTAQASLDAGAPDARTDAPHEGSRP